MLDRLEGQADVAPPDVALNVASERLLVVLPGNEFPVFDDSVYGLAFFICSLYEFT